MSQFPEKQFGSMDGLNSLEPTPPPTIGSRMPIHKCYSSNAIAALSFNSVYSNIWKVLLHQTVDPHPEVAAMARNLVHSVKVKVNTAIYGRCC